jgi:hypothetical protein
MSLVEHARRELELCGQVKEDPAYAQSIVAAVAAFASYDGHSGYSAMAGIEQLSTLLHFGTLSPLTDNPDEWMRVTDAEPMWQSLRNPQAFSTDGGSTYYLLDEREAAGSMDKTPMHRSKQAKAVN